MLIRIFCGLFFLIAALLYLSYLNPATLQIYLAPGIAFPIYTSLLMLSCMGVGAFLVILGVVFRDTRRGVVEWRERARLKKKEKIMDLYHQGVNDLLSKKRNQALTSFQRILEWEPDNVEVLLRMGEVYRYNGNLKEAIRYHSRALTLDRDNLSLLFALAKDYRKADQASEAIEVYRKILRIDHRNTGAFFKLRELYEKKEAWDHAFELQKGYWRLKKAPEEKRRLHYYRLMMAKRLDPERDRDRIVRIYSELMKADRGFPASYLELGRLYESRGEQDAAVKVWKKGFHETGAVVFLEVLDAFYRMRMDPAGMIKIYKSAISRFPENFALKFLLGKFYYRLEMLDDALEIFESLVQKGVSAPVLHQILGDIYYKRGRTEAAMEEFKQSVHFIQPIFIPYSCLRCGYEQEEWSPCCTNCGSLDTFSIHLSHPEKDLALQSADIGQENA